MSTKPLHGKSRTILVSDDDMVVYENISGHRFGVEFTDLFPIESGFAGEVWGFGSTMEIAIAQLFRFNEEYEAFYRGVAIKFVYDDNSK